MDWKDPEDALAFDISMGLKRHKYTKPRDNDATSNDRYYHNVATEVLKQLKLSWTFTRKSDGETVS